MLGYNVLGSHASYVPCSRGLGGNALDGVFEFLRLTKVVVVASAASRAATAAGEAVVPEEEGTGAGLE
jgi:hypothetical protein